MIKQFVTAIIVFVLSIPSYGQICYNHMGYYPTNSSTAKGITTGDYNSDGKIDIATANEYSNNISILFGTGTGTFMPAVNYTVPANPTSIASGDYNNDGKLDLVTNQLSNNVVVLFNDGTGNFVTQQSYSIGLQAYDVLAVDINSDGNMDIATANGFSNNVTIIKGDGIGNFTAPTHYFVSFWANALTSGDFNNDGRPDLAVACNTANYVIILKANTIGGFAPMVSYSVTGGPFDITSGDFNNDGKLDLATACSNANKVSILKGLGVGSFSLTANYIVTQSPVSITCGDYTGDGNIDIVTSNSNYNSNQDVASFLIGTGVGTFTYYGVPLGQYSDDAYSITSADFNNDGRLDIATANNVSNNCTILLMCGGLSTDIEKKFNSKEASIYPNPNNGIFNVKLQNIIQSYQLYNSMGSEVFSKNHINVDEIKVHIDDLPSGLYTIKFTGEKTFYQKIIIE